MAATEVLKTKHGNRVYLQDRAKAKDVSKLRYGIILSYSDVYARDKPAKFSFRTDIKELYYTFYDSLHHYGKPTGFGYIHSKEVLINPVGDLHSRRYFITNNGRKRLERLKTFKTNRVKKEKQDERKRLKNA